LLLAVCAGGLLMAASPQALAQSTVTLRPASGPPGAQVTIHGERFGARKAVTLRLDGRRLARRRTSSRGSFKTSFRVPANASGRLAIVSKSGRRRVVSYFEVSSASLPAAPIVQPNGLFPIDPQPFQPPPVNPPHPPVRDGEPPTAPTGLTAHRLSATRIDVAWTASTDNIAVTGYEILRDGSFLATAAGTSFSDTTADPNTGHDYRVQALDAAGNRSAASDAAAVPPPPPPPPPADNEPPTAPSGLSAGRLSGTRIDLTWSASTDNVAVTGYEILRDGSFLATAAGTSFSDTTADPSSGHDYRVQALDAAGNHSALSDAATLPAPTPQPTFPIRAAFYYPWFPEAWNQLGINPYTKYHPTLGFYSSNDDAIRQSHLRSFEYAKFEAGIYSWWGQGHSTDQRFPAMLAATNARHSPIKWAVYYEREGTTDPAADAIGSDLDYIKSNYAADPSYLKVGGKPVIFVYARGADACPMADRWVQANTPQRDFYVVLKVFAGFRACTSQPQSWHQYAPSTRADRQAGYSYAIAPEFDLTGPEPERLPRDLTAFQQAATNMVASNEPWQLVISFNEWGENTATESADEWSSASGYGQYLDALAGL
jgi:chitodextrinase